MAASGYTTSEVGSMGNSGSVLSWPGALNLSRVNELPAVRRGIKMLFRKAHRGYPGSRFPL